MLTSRTIETLLDLAENKLTAIIPFDREDMREVRALEHCLEELRALKTNPQKAARGMGRRSKQAA